MEIDLNELERYEKQLAERRRTKQTTSSSQSCSTAKTAEVEQSQSKVDEIDEIDAYLDQLAIDLKTKDERNKTMSDATTDTQPICRSQLAQPSGSQNQSEPHQSTNHMTETYTMNGQIIPKPSFALLLLGFLSVLAYVNTVRCKLDIVFKSFKYDSNFHT